MSKCSGQLGGQIAAAMQLQSDEEKWYGKLLQACNMAKVTCFKLLLLNVMKLQDPVRQAAEHLRAAGLHVHEQKL